MAYLLRFLLIVMVLGIALTTSVALGWLSLEFGHIQLAIPTFMYVIFIQAFVMFYFIGVARLVENVWNALNSEANLTELFDEPPKDLEPYKKKEAAPNYVRCNLFFNYLNQPTVFISVRRSIHLAKLSTRESLRTNQSHFYEKI